MSINVPANFIFYVLLGIAVLGLAIFALLKVFDRFRPRLSAKLRGLKLAFGLSLLILLLIGMILVPILVKPIKSGEVGVLWNRFGGTLTTKHFDEGSMLVFPWDTLTIYSSRFNLVQTEISTVTNEGLRVSLDVDIRYRPYRDMLPKLHKWIGKEYVDVLLIPEVESASRHVIANYTAEQIYGASRVTAQCQMYNEVKKALVLRFSKYASDSLDSPLPDTPQDPCEISEGISKITADENAPLTKKQAEESHGRVIELEDILIREVVLPEKVSEAIVKKVNQYYLEQEYKIRVKVAGLEADRKRAEAKGIKDFQSTVTGGISETYLRWRGIEATLELAKSNNAKIVIVGGGKDGLPLILNTGDSDTPSSGDSNTPASDDSDASVSGDNDASVSGDSDSGSGGDTASEGTKAE